MTKKIEPVIDPVELVEDEPVIEPIEVIIDVAPQSTTHLVSDGETYPMIAAILKPVGMTSHQYAKHLYAINGGTPLVAGKIIKL